MSRSKVIGAAVWAAVCLVGCDPGGEMTIPQADIESGTTSVVSAFARALAGSVPDGTQISFVGDLVHLSGSHFRSNMRVYLGMNNAIARRPNSLLTTMRELLPEGPFVYEDPVSGEETKLEVECPFEFITEFDVIIAIPPGVAANAAFTNPVLRMYGDAGSSFPITDIYYITGPRFVAATPKDGLDVGDYSVIVHGDFFSPHTQVAVRYTDPTDHLVKVIGDTAANDIVEHFVDRHTLVVPNWPGVVPNSTLGLAKELGADILLFESIEEIVSDVTLEPGLNGVGALNELLPEGAVPLERRGVRNAEALLAFTYLPTGVTAPPLIQGITPESGPEVGGNTVVIVGQQFDAFTVDISDPDDPGIGIECPPDSGEFVAPLEAFLVDRQTIVVKMPPCPVEVPSKVSFRLKNKFSIDNAAILGSDGVVFEDIYTYLPVPPIVPPVVTAIYPATANPQPQGSAHDYGLERLVVVGDWFDADTTLNGGFEFLLPGGEVVQSQRTILHNRNLIEVFTKRLPAPYYPLVADLHAGVRVRNSVGHTDVADAVIFAGTPDAGAAPRLDSILEAAGPVFGGNRILLFGANFDTGSEVFFGAAESGDVQFLGSGLLAATVPPAAGPQVVDVTVRDDGEWSAARSYAYTLSPPPPCPILGVLSPATGTHVGGYHVLAYGAGLTPTTRVEFGAGDGNFSEEIFFVSDMLLSVKVPEAYPAQIGATVPVGATDPWNGCDTALRTTGFAYVSALADPPEILFVDTTVEDPATPTTLPALNTTGGDRLLVVGTNFDQSTSFDLTKPQGSQTKRAVTGLRVLTPNLATMTAPASPDGSAGVADLRAHNAFGDSAPFAVEYVAPPPPKILDVRNLDDGSQTAAIDGNKRLLIFGSGFIDRPAGTLKVRLTGRSLANPPDSVTVTLSGAGVTVVDDILIGVNVPAGTFLEGPLDIEVETAYGTAAFDDAGGNPLFLLVGPQPPAVTGVYPQKFNSGGGEEAVLFGRNFTPTTQFRVQTDLMGSNVPVLSTRVVDETTAIVVMPVLLGGMPPLGAAGRVRAEETDALLRSKITDPDFTESSYADPLFRVCNDAAPLLLGVFPDRGTIDGGEPVILLGANFLRTDGTPNVTDLRVTDAILGDVGDYSPASPADLPLGSGDASKRGKYQILNDHEILLLTHPRARVTPEDSVAAEAVTVLSPNGNSTLQGGFGYVNTPAVRTPFLLGITPNETRLSGGTSHLLSGGFLDEADRIVFTRESDAKSYAIPTGGGSFSEVNSEFLLFVMPDLSGSFASGDTLDVRAEKDVAGAGTLVSNTLKLAIRVTFAGPPAITPALSPSTGTAFGGTVVEISGTLFSPNSQVLFGTMPARNVVFASATKLYAVAPTLPLDALDPPNAGLDLRNLAGHPDPKVDVAVFTPGGWAVLPDAFTFTKEAPSLLSASPAATREGATTRITLSGARFLPGDTTVTPSAGSVSNLVAHGFESLSFDYTAPAFAAGTLGPKSADLTVATSHGSAAPLALEIALRPFITSVKTSYTPNDGAAPTTGVQGGTRVLVTVEGGNFSAGGSLVVEPRIAAPVALREDPVLDQAAEFRVLSGTKMEFTVPYQFPAGSPNLIDGNPSTGPADLRYVSPLAMEAAKTAAFRYVPAVPDFQDYRFTLPNVYPDLLGPAKISTGDINGDGVPDAAVLVQKTGSHLELPEAFLFLADTFGAGFDVNGDGLAADFAGTFTQLTVSNDTVKSYHEYFTPGQEILLANLDGDANPELVIPASIAPGSAHLVRLLLVDVTSTGALSTQTVLSPALSDSQWISGLAAGRFDSSHSGTDLALLVGHNDPSKRKLVILRSTATPFSFTENVVDLPSPFENYWAGPLSAGDFDSDGDEDLLWGQIADTVSVPAIFEDFPLVVAKVDAGAGTVGAPQQVTNLTGGAVHDIEVFDTNGDGRVDAVVSVRDRADGTFLGGVVTPGGIAVLTDPLALLVSSYTQSGFRQNKPLEAAGTDAAAAHADFNGDGIGDVAVTSDEGEFALFLGDGKGAFATAGRTWQLVTSPGPFLTKVTGLAAADLNRDGIAEILMGDKGGLPFNLVVWLNASR